uniref:Uncharacterized protein n=1 Tax=Anguilla anguilla TaxID=7936 RepID=A0A0E9RNR2_ANGAN
MSTHTCTHPRTQTRAHTHTHSLPHLVLFHSFYPCLSTYNLKSGGVGV